MDTYKAGTSIRIDIEIKDSDDAYIDPSSVTITISKSGTAAVDGEDMTKESTGKYYYIWQSETTTTAGTHDVMVTAVVGDYTSIKEDTRALVVKA